MERGPWGGDPRCPWTRSYSVRIESRLQRNGWSFTSRSLPRCIFDFLSMFRIFRIHFMDFHWLLLWRVEEDWGMKFHKWIDITTLQNACTDGSLYQGCCCKPFRTFNYVQVFGVSLLSANRVMFNLLEQISLSGFCSSSPTAPQTHPGPMSWPLWWNASIPLMTGTKGPFVTRSK